MNIPEEILQKWSNLRSEGDTKEIAEIAGVHKNTIMTAFRERKCNIRVFQAMAAFYDKRAELVKQYL